MASYGSTLVDTPITLEFSWAFPEGVSNETTLIFSSSSESTLTLSPVDQPLTNSGEYTCIVTVQSENMLIISGTGSSSVVLSVLGRSEWFGVTNQFVYVCVNFGEGIWNV